MNYLKKLMNPMILVTLLTLLFTGCYYDVAEELYPDNNAVCDTTGVTYTKTIQPILNEYCNSCHTGSAPSGSVDFSTYDFVKAYALDGSLYGSMSHDPNWSEMPQGGNKVDDCTLLKIKVWIDNGMPE